MERNNLILVLRGLLLSYDPSKEIVALFEQEGGARRLYHIEPEEINLGGASDNYPLGIN